MSAPFWRRVSMNRAERINKLVQLVELAGGHIDTRKKFQKLVYLLQEAGEEFEQDYFYHNYGVFSPSLANDLETACSSEANILKQNTMFGSGFSYSLGESAAFPVQEESFNAKTKVIIEKLAGKEPRFLEVLSTIVYLHRNHYTGDKLREKLKELKPELEEHFTEAYEEAEASYSIAV